MAAERLTRSIRQRETIRPAHRPESLFQMNKISPQKWIAILFLALVVNTGYIAAFASATIFYMSNVLLHLVLGVVLAGAVVWALKRNLIPRTTISLGFFALALVFGLVLTYKGNTHANALLLKAHIISACLGLAALIPWIWKKAAIEGGGWVEFRKGFQIAVIVLVGFPLLMMGYRRAVPNPHDRITNPPHAPTAPEEEGGGPRSPFFPSSAKTNIGGIIPSNFFMDSETCGECHKQIYDEWKSSSHHFASFNNQFYRKAIEYMQDTQGSPQSSKWCAGCHDHAVFFNGRFEKPIEPQIDTPEAHAGLACTSCHAITHVDSTMGNGGFTIEYPALHQLMTSRNRIIRSAVDFMTYLDPEPHRETFIKPFMRQQAAQFCSACHKVHLDIPVNGYKWFRGFNDYDNWQASGFGEGARSFYYPPKGQTCVDCHMPLEPSSENGNYSSQIHAHRFAAANTALATANMDKTQLEADEKFLTSGFITVDIFAVSPVEANGQTKMIRRAATGPQLSSGTPVGEEAEQSGDTFIREVGKVAAPLDVARPKLVPGSTARVDIVVRTRKIGHFFPAGTLDAFDIWLELQATDATGRTVFWSGKTEDNGRGPVEPGAHFYRAYQLDAQGNPINKRNAWQARSVLYAHAIPPGAADTVHYLLDIPKDAKGPIHLTARLNDRKFSWFYTQWAYAGKPKPGQDPALLSKDHNGLDYSFDKVNIPANVSGEIKDRVPDLPITVLASANANIDLTTNPGDTQWKPVADKKDRERWNDWGIGLLLQGDVKGAEYAFRKVTEAEPGYADGWLNVARALIQEGETDAAKPFIRKALEIDSSLGRIYYFRSQIEKADGDYDAALKSLNIVVSKYPRDRVVWNQIGRLLFLKRQYKDAIAALQQVGRIDPEDLQMHYTAMLAYRGLGDQADALREQKLFERFKALESAQSITAIRRMISPEDNNERQAIHDHESVSLVPVRQAKPIPEPMKTAATHSKASTENAGGGVQ